MNSEPLKTLFNIVSGIVLGILPVTGAALIGLFIYNDFPNIIGLTICAVLLILSIYVGYQIFRKIQIVGVTEFMAATRASPELDNLELASSSSTKNRTAEEMAHLIATKQSLIQSGCIRIYNDWYGQSFELELVLEHSEYDNERGLLTIKFKSGELLEIFAPKGIHESPTFLKIMHANRIRLSNANYGRTNISEQSYFIDYVKLTNSFETKSNIDWYTPLFDVSLGSPALVIYGKFN